MHLIYNEGRNVMELFVGLDVSLMETSICVVDRDGTIVEEGTVLSNPGSIADYLEDKTHDVTRVGLESGPTSTWLWHELKALGFPVICIDARHAKAALAMQVNKTDRNDAIGIARIMQTGWFREVQVKRLSCHEVRAALNSRALLVKMKRDVENQMRGILKNFGLIIGKVGRSAFPIRVRVLLEERPILERAILPLLGLREQLKAEITEFDRMFLQMTRDNDTARRLTTVPGIGPITALTFISAIDDPARFRRSRSVGAYIGLTPKRYASGEIDRMGRISRCGDGMLRSYLYEAAGVLLTRVPKWSPIKAWGVRLAKRIGFKKAKIAVARKLAVIMHRMWCDGTDFQWTSKETNA
jgi:transposase